MNDIRTTTEPKSDRLNADSLIGGKSLTIKVTKVSLVAGDQPVSISFENDGGKPYYPCKSMRRVLVNVWGPDGNAYIGRSLTLYCDEKVQFGGMAVGGIRISHMSHIDKPVAMALTTTRAKRTPFTVKPLVTDAPCLATSQQQKDLWERAKAAGVTPDEFMQRFGSLKALAADKVGEVEAWLTEREDVMAVTCDTCNELLIEGACNNSDCEKGVPPNE